MSRIWSWTKIIFTTKQKLTEGRCQNTFRDTWTSSSNSMQILEQFLSGHRKLSSSLSVTVLHSWEICVSFCDDYTTYPIDFRSFPVQWNVEFIVYFESSRKVGVINGFRLAVSRPVYSRLSPADGMRCKLIPWWLKCQMSIVEWFFSFLQFCVTERFGWEIGLPEFCSLFWSFSSTSAWVVE